jgi:hypothetical protein
LAEGSTGLDIESRTRQSFSSQKAFPHRQRIFGGESRKRQSAQVNSAEDGWEEISPGILRENSEEYRQAFRCSRKSHDHLDWIM